MQQGQRNEQPPTGRLSDPQCHRSQEESQWRAAHISHEHPRSGKIMRQESRCRTGDHEGEQDGPTRPVPAGQPSQKSRSGRRKHGLTCRDAVYSIHEIEGVGVAGKPKEHQTDATPYPWFKGLRGRDFDAELRPSEQRQGCQRGDCMSGKPDRGRQRFQVIPERKNGQKQSKTNQGDHYHAYPRCTDEKRSQDDGPQDGDAAATDGGVIVAGSDVGLVHDAEASEEGANGKAQNETGGECDRRQSYWGTEGTDYHYR